MIAAIDGDHVAFLVCHNKKVKDKSGKAVLLNGEPVYEERSLQDMKDLADSYMKHMCKKAKADKFVLALTRGKCFRYDLYPDYKANRKGLGDKRPDHFYEISQYVMDKYNGLVVPGYEADDIVASYKKKYGVDCTVVSTDKDLLECIVGSHFNPKKNITVATSTYDAEFNFWKSMIVGDVTDNIKGLPQHGAAFFQKMLTNGECGTMYQKTLKAYFDHYSDFNMAVDEFYKNYKCLRLEDNIENLPEPLNCADFGL